MAKWDEKHTGSSCPHPHEPVGHARRAQRVPGRPAARPGEGQRHLPLVPRRLDEARARALAACYAPYVASYKRYQSRSWAPTGIAWSYDNRTAGFRVVGHGSSLRIECRSRARTPTPTSPTPRRSPPAWTASRNKIEPPEIFQGDVYAARDLPRVPGTLREAIDEFEHSELAREAFGEDVAEHYLHFLKTEQRKFDEVVTSWERERYFERA